MFDAYQHEIAQAYAEINPLPDGFNPLGSSPLAKAWRELGEDSRERAAGVRLLLEVEETPNDEPYSGAGEMLGDIAAGHFFVSTTHSEHPLWDLETNVAFRIVHDVLGHYAASVALGWPNDDPESQRITVAGFDWYGENLACAAHVPLLPSQLARTALFTECLGQTSWAIKNGFSALEQKVGDITDFMFNMDNSEWQRDDAETEIDRWLRGKVFV